MEKNNLQIGEAYEVREATKDESYGPLVYIRNNPSEGFSVFAKDGERPALYLATVDRTIKPSITDPRKRSEGQLEKVCVSKVTVKEMTNRFDVRDLKAEIKFKQDRFKMKMETRQ